MSTPETTPEEEPFQFSTPVKLDPNFKRTIRDIKLFARLPMLERDPDLAAELIPDVIELLDRSVVGGIENRPVEEFWPIVEEMTRQMKAAGNPKN